MTPSRKWVVIAPLVGLLTVTAAVVLFVTPGYLVARPASGVPSLSLPGGNATSSRCPPNISTLGPAHCETVSVSLPRPEGCGDGPVSAYKFRDVSFAFDNYVPCSVSPVATWINTTVTEANGTRFNFELVNAAPGLLWVNWTSPDQSVAIDWQTTTWNFTLIVASGGYPITFLETGLPAGTNWSVTLNGSLGWSTSDSIGFIDANGTYAFNASATGYTAVSSLSSPLTVSGSAVRDTITFSVNPSQTVGPPNLPIAVGPPQRDC